MGKLNAAGPARPQDGDIQSALHPWIRCEQWTSLDSRHDQNWFGMGRIPCLRARAAATAGRSSSRPRAGSRRGPRRSTDSNDLTPLCRILDDGDLPLGPVFGILIRCARSSASCTASTGFTETSLRKRLSSVWRQAKCSCGADRLSFGLQRITE